MRTTQKKALNRVNRLLVLRLIQKRFVTVRSSRQGHIGFFFAKSQI